MKHTNLLVTITRHGYIARRTNRLEKEGILRVRNGRLRSDRPLTGTEDALTI